jgi:cytoskeleton protein RodZ
MPSERAAPVGPFGSTNMDVGTQLRHAREAKGVSIPALAATTRIRTRVLEAIERNDLSAIPPGPYARGFIASYAREVGLNPAETVRSFLAQFDAPVADPQPEAARQVAPVALRQRALLPATGALVLIITVAALRVWPTGAITPPEAGAVGTSGAAATSSRAAAPTGATGRATSPSGSPVKGSEVMVVLETEHPCWVSATVDGRRILYRVLEAGVKETLRGSRAIRIRVGDAGAVRWSVDGRQPELMGRRGQVRTTTVTPEPAAAPGGTPPDVR